MLILCDFDGTATQFDTQNFLAKRFAPNAFDALEGQMFSGEKTLHEVLAGELAAISAPAEEVLAAAVGGLPLREGFAQFVAATADAGHRLVILSSGFRQLIEPLMAAGGIDPAGVELVANDIDFTGSGIAARFRAGSDCASCGQRCKRDDALALIASEPGRRSVYIGDGFSDRCSAQVAGRIFARAGLATYLDERALPFEEFDDFFEIADALELPIARP